VKVLQVLVRDLSLSLIVGVRALWLIVLIPADPAVRVRGAEVVPLLVVRLKLRLLVVH